MSAIGRRSVREAAWSAIPERVSIGMDPDELVTIQVIDADESVVGEGRCEHRHVGVGRSHASAATGPRGAHSCRIDLVDEVVHATGVGVGMDDDECPSVTGVAAEDVVVAMRDKRVLGSFPLVASGEPVLRPHGCK
jgi:hypothetical protein